MACTDSVIILIVLITEFLAFKKPAVRFAAESAIESTCARVILVASSMKLTRSCSESPESLRQEEELE